MQLFDYQKESVKWVIDNWQEHKKLLLALPTGAGKTVIASEVIKQFPDKKILFTVHRRNLLTQTVNVFSELITPDIGIVCAEVRHYRRITVATVQSAFKDNNLSPDIIIFDEIHWGADTAYIGKIIANNPNAKLLGISATPFDSRGYVLEGFDQYKIGAQIPDLIERKRLCNVQHYAPKPIFMDVSKVKINNSTGDYNQDELEKVAMQSNQSIVDNYLSHGQGRKAIAYCVSIEHAKQLAATFNRNNIKTEAIYSGIPEQVNKDNYRSFTKGNTQVITNVDMLTTGLDLPWLDCIILCRPTKSLSLFLQICGRGLRVSLGKSDCLILDCANNLYEHGLLTEKKKFTRRLLYSREIDKSLDIDELNRSTSKEHPFFDESSLIGIGKLLDLYRDKNYEDEDKQLLPDAKKFLSKIAELYWWRQNSGKIKSGDSWLHFTDKPGLPDLTVLLPNKLTKGFSYVGIELKGKKKSFTKHQLDVLPELYDLGIMVFIVHNIVELWECLDYSMRILCGEELPELPSQKSYIEEIKNKRSRQVIKEREQDSWLNISSYQNRRSK